MVAVPRIKQLVLFHNRLRFSISSLSLSHVRELQLQLQLGLPRGAGGAKIASVAAAAVIECSNCTFIFIDSVLGFLKGEPPLLVVALFEEVHIQTAYLDSLISLGSMHEYLQQLAFHLGVGEVDLKVLAAVEWFSCEVVVTQRHVNNN